MKRNTRKLNNTYYFTVEGETEVYYFQRLQVLINESALAHRRIAIKAKKETNPVSFAKRETIIYSTSVTHVFDRESEDNYHKIKFSDTLKAMRRAEEILPAITYQLAYSNFTFDLWIILHKADCNGHKSRRTQYLREINRAYNKNFLDMDDFKREANLKEVLKQIELDDVIMAISRAKSITKYNQENYKPRNEFNYEYYTENPSLSIWESVESMLIDCGIIKNTKGI